MNHSVSPQSRAVWRASALLMALCAGLWAGTATHADDSTELTPHALAALWDREHVSPPLSPLLAHAEMERQLREFHRAAPDLFSMEEIARSVEGRSIQHLWFGQGAFAVLMWSQMHGDEPTATSALLDLLEYVRQHREEPAVRRMLERLTIHLVPMLNPDGAERFQRRNAQGIDINRDALALQTPEGRALKALRDRLEPAIGFNLHNQSWRTSVGRPPRPASISLLAVAFDEARRDSPGRILAKQVGAVVREAVEPFAEGQIGRYDDEFEPRAFGDNITRWSTPVVLVETGPWPPPDPDRALVRLNFVALVMALDALASGRAQRTDPAGYESLPMNESRLFYRLVRNARIVPGTGVVPFTGDIGIGAVRTVETIDHRRRVLVRSRIEDLGDLHVFGALEIVEAEGLTAVPRFDRTLKAGDRLHLPEWASRDADRPVIAVGQPGGLLLLRPDGRYEGAYRVERVIGAEEVF
jgi:hypothetical protein